MVTLAAYIQNKKIEALTSVRFLCKLVANLFTCTLLQ